MHKIFIENKKYLKPAIVVLFALFLIFVLKSFIYSDHLRHDVTVVFPHGEVKAQVAETESAHKLGLSHRKTILDNEGLLFVFDKPGNYYFWMKDMNFPVDIIWISSDERIVHIEEDVATSTYPKSFINNSKALYVLEIKANTRKDLGAFLGTEIKINGL